jgi:hypothetical protein
LRGAYKAVHRRRCCGDVGPAGGVVPGVWLGSAFPWGRWLWPVLGWFRGWPGWVRWVRWVVVRLGWLSPVWMIIRVRCGFGLAGRGFRIHMCLERFLPGGLFARGGCRAVLVAESLGFRGHAWTGPVRAFPSVWLGGASVLREGFGFPPGGFGLLPGLRSCAGALVC